MSCVSLLDQMQDALLRAYLPFQLNMRRTLITCASHLRKREARVIQAHIALGARAQNFSSRVVSRNT
jgi:hypothetical protein